MARWRRSRSSPRVPVDQIRRIGLDTSSRTSAGLTRILCREAWRIDPSFELLPPDAARAAGCDAALVIGDPALFLDDAAAGLTKIDLGAEWTRMTGLPFVWAFWAGRAGAAWAPEGRALCRRRGTLGWRSRTRSLTRTAAQASALCRAYLRDNIKYRLGPRELAGLRRYYQLRGRPCGSIEVTRLATVALYDS